MTTYRDRKVYDFKSVGEINFEIEKRKIQAEPIPIGIKTPLTMGGDKGIWKMHMNLQDQLADNLRNLILTNWGERLGNYYYGANLMSLVFELAKDDVATEAMKRIKMAVQKSMPFISLLGFAPEIDHHDNKEVAKIAILVTYIIPKTSSKQKAIRIVLYVGG
jgi:phage baseplate assembly protein W